MVDASFGLDQQARVDYGYAAIGKVTAAAKALVQRYYDRPRPSTPISPAVPTAAAEALIAAERFPLHVRRHRRRRPDAALLARGDRRGVEPRVLGEGRSEGSRRASDHRQGLFAWLTLACEDRPAQALRRARRAGRRADPGLAGVRLRSRRSSSAARARRRAACHPGRWSALRELHRGPHTPAAGRSTGRSITTPASPGTRGAACGSARPIGRGNSADATLGLGMLRISS